MDDETLAPSPWKAAELLFAASLKAFALWAERSLKYAPEASNAALLLVAASLKTVALLSLRSPRAVREALAAEAVLTLSSSTLGAREAELQRRMRETTNKGEKKGVHLSVSVC